MATRFTKISVLSVLATCVAMGAWSASAGANSIAVHFSNYGGNGTSNITGSDGYVPVINWNNLGVNWFSGGGSNLVDNSATPTTAAVTVVAYPCGTYWWVNGPAGGVDNLLEGPWGGDGGGGAEAIPAKITGIPYANYTLIAYTNPPYAGDHAVWLDSNATASNAYNAPVAGSEYYYHQDSTAFDVMTNNTDSAHTEKANTVVYTNLSGPIQTIWDGGLGGATNGGISGFEIIDTPVTAPEPASLGLIGLASIALLRRRR